MQTRQALLQEAERIRRGFERIKPDETGAISCFPDECCNHATNVMILHLLDQGWAADQMTMLVGCVPGSADRHCWLKVQGFHVDITGRQFDQDDVVVTDTSPWHESLGNVETRPVTREKADRYKAAPQWHRKILESEAG